MEDLLGRRRWRLDRLVDRVVAAQPPHVGREQEALRVGELELAAQDQRHARKLVCAGLGERVLEELELFRLAHVVAHPILRGERRIALDDR